MRIKNWEKFQHFKDRNPPWIKLYNDLLDDPDWHGLSGDDAKLLVMLWLIAGKEKGALPAIKKLSFRLRISEKVLNDSLSRLCHWLNLDDIKPISPQHQVDAPETETETETETTGKPSGSRNGFFPKKPKEVKRGSAGRRVLDSLVEAFRNQQKEKIGEEPTTLPKKQIGANIRHWIKAGYTWEDILRRMGTYFKSEDPWIVKNGYAWGIFYKKFNDCRDGGPLNQEKEDSRFSWANKSFEDRKKAGKT